MSQGQGIGARVFRWRLGLFESDKCIRGGLARSQIGSVKKVGILRTCEGTGVGLNIRESARLCFLFCKTNVNVT